MTQILYSLIFPLIMIRNKWLKYLEKENLKGIQLISKSQKETSRTLNFAGIPMHFIVDPEGNYKKYKSFTVARKVIELH
jgi:hypothetical protein